LHRQGAHNWYEKSDVLAEEYDKQSWRRSSFRAYDGEGFFRANLAILLWFPGDWSQHSVYLAKSWDGFHFTTPVKTDLANDASIKYYQGPFDERRQVFIALTVIGKANGFAISKDGIHWVPKGSDISIGSIGTAVDGHYAAPGPATIVGDEGGNFSSLSVNILQSGRLLRAGEQGLKLGCYNASEDRSRGSSRAISSPMPRLGEATVPQASRPRIAMSGWRIWRSLWGRISPNERLFRIELRRWLALSSHRPPAASGITTARRPDAQLIAQGERAARLAWNLKKNLTRTSPPRRRWNPRCFACRTTLKNWPLSQRERLEYTAWRSWLLR
jgi:hypothetical protein